MVKTIKHDDSNLIWFDYDTIDDFNYLDSLNLSNFDITNVPTFCSGIDFTMNAKIHPIELEFDNYMVTFFEDSKSKTGYSCMCLNKSREIYKSKNGYVNGMPLEEY